MQLLKCALRSYHHRQKDYHHMASARIYLKQPDGTPAGWVRSDAAWYDPANPARPIPNPAAYNALEGHEAIVVSTREHPRPPTFKHRSGVDGTWHDVTDAAWVVTALGLPDGHSFGHTTGDYPGAKRTQNLSLRVSSAEWDAFAAAAESAGNGSVHEWMRAVALAAAGKPAEAAAPNRRGPRLAPAPVAGPAPVLEPLEETPDTAPNPTAFSGTLDHSSEMLVPLARRGEEPAQLSADETVVGHPVPAPVRKRVRLTTKKV